MDDELLGVFVSEAREHLATIEADLLTIEESGANVDKELVNKVFRAAHSIKGASSFFGLQKVKDLAHKLETVLDMLRSGKMVPNAEITNVLLAAFDQLREMINHYAESEDADISEMTLNLDGLASAYLSPEHKASLVQSVSLQAEGDASRVTLPQSDYLRAKSAGQILYSAEYDLIHDIERRGQNVLEVVRQLCEHGEILDCTVDFEAAGTLDDPVGRRLPLRLIFATRIPPDDIGFLFPFNRERVRRISDSAVPVSAPLVDASTDAEAVAVPAPHSEQAKAVHSDVRATGSSKEPVEVPHGSTASKTVAPVAHAVVEETIRVNVGVLEQLMNLAGELVLGRNQLRASIAQKNPRALAAADQRINQITSELQDVIMQTRLQPIGNVFGKFPRVVRDLSAALKKEIQLDIKGKDVALDKSLIEALSDPLTHMVRNAVDHGVEMPETRILAGKKAQGTVSIDARHEAGQVVVEIADDGQGIDPERIAQAALAKGLITSEKLQAMSAQEKTALIFLPGLSTAKSVSDISGRGVGMDVVKTNLNRLGGKVEITSAVGRGTTFLIKLPLTLAIIPALIFSVEGERFAIPQINVEELLRVQPDGSKTRIEVVGDTEVLVLRDRLIPLVRFADLLGVLPTYTDQKSGSQEVDRRTRLADRRSPSHGVSELESDAWQSTSPAEETFTRNTLDIRNTLDTRNTLDRRRNSSGAMEIAVVTTGTQTYALVVGGFHDTEEIVVKPLGRHLKTLVEYAGATILGDGTVALILDVGGLAAKANLGTVSGTARARELSEATQQEKLIDTQALLLFHNAPEELCAVPLDTVSRIEHIRPQQVENRGGRRTMQYCGGFLPLVTLADSAQVKAIEDTQDLAVMICRMRGREVGLLGTMPVDVIETCATIDQKTHRQKGVAGSAILREQTALIVDLFELVDMVWPEWAVEQLAESPRGPASKSSAVLLAEDSDFFRTQVVRFLEEDGHTVLAAPDGEAAWETLLGNLEKVRVVVTDIEMPRMNGMDLARRIRADERTARLPVIALSSLAGDEDIARGKAAGIDEYLVKLDRDSLLERVREVCT